MNTADGQTFLTIAISAFLFFTLGGLAGWLVSLLSAPKKSPQKSDEASKAQSVPDSSPDSEKIELARIYRRQEDNQVFLETNGKIINTPADIHPAERAWLVLAVEAIYQLLGQESALVEPTPPNQPAAAALPPIEWQPSPPVEIQKPSMKPVDVIIRAAQAGQTKPDQPKRLVEQIDAVLQEILAQSPLPTGEIHLAENASLGLEVRVGNQRYDGIEAVPDERIRRVIRAAITEWQRQSR